MAQNCKIKLILKSKKSNMFETIFDDAPPRVTAIKKSVSKQLEKKAMLQTKNTQKEGIRAKIDRQIQKDNGSKKSFKNTKIKDSFIQLSEPQFPEFQYCYTFQTSGRKKQELEGIMCEGKRAQYCRQSKSATKSSRAMSRQLSEKGPRLRRPSTSHYLTHKKTGYVQLDKFTRKKPWSMNPFHYEEMYMEKLKVSLDFYFKVQYANRVSVSLSLSSPHSQRFRVYVGPGNNQFTVQQTLRKRFWYEVVYEPKDCYFYWTQNELKSIHDLQPSLKMHKKLEYFQEHDNSRGDILTEQEKKKYLERVTLNKKILSKGDSKTVQKHMDEKGYHFIYPSLNCLAITNHLPCSQLLNERKHVLRSIQDYYQKYKFKDPWEIMPKTFFVCNPSRADIHFYTDMVLKNKKKLWIIKPGERSNYQNEIEILPGAKVMDKIRKLIKYGDQPWTFLLQEYIESPFLYKGRKMDLRHFILITSIGGGLKAYWYYQGYIRTCSKPFKLTDLNPFIHLTSDAIQEKAPEYGLHEPQNKLTYNDFERYLRTFDPNEPHSFQEQIIPKMKQITLDLLHASYKKLDPQRKGCNFEVVGLDFQLGQDLEVFLTGVNTNPSFRTDNPVLGKIMPSIIDQSLWLAVDPFLPPRTHFPAGERLKLGADPLYSLRFQCIFDEFQL